MNTQIPTHSGTVPGTFRNTNVENQEPNEDRSKDDPHLEVGPSVCNSLHSNDSDPDEAPHVVTRVQEEIRYRPQMVTRVQEEICYRPQVVTGVREEIRYRPHFVRGVQEEIPHCSPGTLSRKQKKARSKSQPQIRSENTPPTIESDQILLALQQLATKSNSSNFNNNINRISKLPKFLTTTMPTFDGKSKKFELFEDLIQTSLKLHNQLTEEHKIKHFQSVVRGAALQTIKNMSSPKG